MEVPNAVLFRRTPFLTMDIFIYLLYIFDICVYIHSLYRFFTVYLTLIYFLCCCFCCFCCSCVFFPFLPATEEKEKVIDDDEEEKKKKNHSNRFQRL